MAEREPTRRELIAEINRLNHPQVKAGKASGALRQRIVVLERENAALRGLLIEVRDASRAWGFPTVADTIDRRLAALGQQPHTEGKES